TFASSFRPNCERAFLSVRFRRLPVDQLLAAGRVLPPARAAASHSPQTDDVRSWQVCKQTELARSPCLSPARRTSAKPATRRSTSSTCSPPTASRTTRPASNAATARASSRLAATLPWTAFCTARRTLNSSSRRRGTSPRNSKVEVEHLQTRTTRYYGSSDPLNKLFKSDKL
ncbi:LIM domain-containing protein PLIM2b, partial [Zea mays]